MPRSALAVLLLTLLSPGAGRAQALPVSELRPGDRIRITDTRGEVREGLFEATWGDTLLWRPGSSSRSSPAFQPSLLAFREIGTLEQSLGESRVNWNAALFTSVALILAGGAARAVTWEPCKEKGWFSCFMEPRSRAEAFGWGAAMGAVVGLPVGFAVGVLVGRERWGEIQLPALTPGFHSLPGGRWGLALSLRAGG